MSLKIITATVLAILVTAPAASAGPLKNAWDRQQVSIGNGVVNGSITPTEAIRLERQARSIRNQARYLKSTGGGLSPLEKVYIGTRLVASRGAIFYHKHN